MAVMDGELGAYFRRNSVPLVESRGYYCSVQTSGKNCLCVLMLHLVSYHRDWSLMDYENCPRKHEVDTYLREHRIVELFQNIISMLIYHQPGELRNPAIFYAYLIPVKVAVWRHSAPSEGKSFGSSRHVTANLTSWGSAPSSHA